MVRVQYGSERATVYAEGGIHYDRHERGIGWIVDDSPSLIIQTLAGIVHRGLCRVHAEPALTD